MCKTKQIAVSVKCGVLSHERFFLTPEIRNPTGTPAELRFHVVQEERRPVSKEHEDVSQLTVNIRAHSCIWQPAFASQVPKQCSFTGSEEDGSMAGKRPPQRLCTEFSVTTARSPFGHERKWHLGSAWEIEEPTLRSGLPMTCLCHHTHLKPPLLQGNRFF